MDIPFEIIFRLILGALIGGIIGLEREVHGRSAGLRTQLIVCVAAVLIMIISENYHLYLKDPHPALRIDPARIASGAVIGVGFIGAGVIIKSGFTIRGLTTAASIWVVSAIGLAIGSGLYIEGICTFIITITALIVLRRVERHLRTPHFKVVTVVTDTERMDADREIASVLSRHGINIISLDIEVERKTGESTFLYTVSTDKEDAVRDAFLKLGNMGFVKRLKVESHYRPTPN